MKNPPVIVIVMILLGFNCCVVAVHAATPATLYAMSEQNTSASSETTVGIYLKNSFKPEIGSLTFSLKYDENALAVRKIVVSGGGVSPLSFSSPLIIAIATPSGIPNGDTWLANITFVSRIPTGSTTNLILDANVIDDISIPPMDHSTNLTLQNGIIPIGPASISLITQEQTSRPTFIAPEEIPASFMDSSSINPSLTTTIVSTSLEQPSPLVTSRSERTDTIIQHNTAVPSGNTTSQNTETPTMILPTSQKSPGLGFGIALVGLCVWMITRKKSKFWNWWTIMTLQIFFTNMVFISEILSSVNLIKTDEYHHSLRTDMKDLQTKFFKGRLEWNEN